MSNTAAAGPSPIDIVVIGFQGNQFNGAVTSMTGTDFEDGASSPFPQVTLDQSAGSADTH